MIKKLILKYFPSEERFWEVFRFLLVGGGCFVLEYVLLYTLTEYGGLPPLYSAPIAFTVSLILNYFLCVSFVFHAEHQSRSQVVLFVVTSLMGQSHRFGHRHDLELLHQTLHSAPLIMIRK